jgi:hypothetical protein
MFTLQIFHPESGLYLNTNHESQDLEQLKSLLQTGMLDGLRIQIVDQDGAVHFGPISRDRKGLPSVEDIARSFGVPMSDPLDIDVDDE